MRIPDDLIYFISEPISPDEEIRIWHFLRHGFLPPTIFGWNPPGVPWQVLVYRQHMITNGPESGKVPDFMGKTPAGKAFWAAVWRLRWSKRGKSGFGHIHIETKDDHSNIVC